MKYILLMLIFISINVNAQSICEENVSKDFLFTYKIENQKLIYKIVSKKNELINFFYIKKYNYSNNIGFNIVTDKKDDIIGRDPSDFFQENGNFYSINLVRGTTPHSIGNIDNSSYFKKEKEITESINIKKFANLFQVHIEEEKRYGIKKIKFKIKLILDEEFKKCAQFSTDTFYYDFGSKFNLEFRENFNQLIYLWREG